MIEELLSEDVDAELEGLEEIVDELEARTALIAIEKSERDAAHFKRLKGRIVEQYDAKIAAATERAQFLRTQLLGYVKREGKASFPDVGTAYTSKTKSKVVVSDPEIVRREFGALFVRDPTFDETAFRQWAIERFETTGEIPPGCDVVPAGETLAIRKA